MSFFGFGRKNSKNSINEEISSKENSTIDQISYNSVNMESINIEYNQDINSYTGVLNMVNPTSFPVGDPTWTTIGTTSPITETYTFPTTVNPYIHISGPATPAGGSGSWTSAGAGGVGIGGGSGYHYLGATGVDYNQFNHNQTYDTIFCRFPSHINKLNITLEDNSTEIITQEELLKYIEERKLRQENEIVAYEWKRYQTAVKLTRSDDDTPKKS